MLSERQKEIAQISRGTGKYRKSDAGFFKPILPETLPNQPQTEVTGHPLPLLDLLIPIL